MEEREVLQKSVILMLHLFWLLYRAPENIKELGSSVAIQCENFRQTRQSLSTNENWACIVVIVQLSCL